MIESITVRNFRSFGDAETEIVIRPINLIFGANSSGKSSVMKALLLLRGAFHSGSFDIFKLEGINKDVDLGGIDNMIHRKDVGRDIEIGISFKIKMENSLLDSEMRRSRIKFTIGRDISEEYEDLTRGLKKVSIYIEGKKIMTFRGEDLRGINYKDKDIGRAISLVEFDSENELFASEILRFRKSIIRFADSSNLEKDQAFKANIDEFSRFVIMQISMGEKSILTGSRLRDYLLFKEQGEWGNVTHAMLQRAEILMIPFMKDFFESEEVNGMSELYDDIDGYGKRRLVDPKFNFKNEDLHEIMCNNYELMQLIGDNPAVQREYSRLSVVVNAVAILQDAIYSTIESIFGGLSDLLQEVAYLGPMRTIPDRINGLEKTSNSDELKSWNSLKADHVIRDRVNHWLGKRFKLNYKIVALKFYAGAELEDYVEYSVFNSMVESLPLMSGAIVRYLKKEGVSDKKIGRALEALRQSVEDGNDEFLPRHVVKEPGAFRNLFSSVDPIKAVDEDVNLDRLTLETNERRGLYLLDKYQTHKRNTTPAHNTRELAVIDEKFDTYVGFQDIGVGLSQLLPVIVSCISEEGEVLLIEQPELHVHPGLQSEIADLFIDSYNKNSKKIFIVETHSEHLILRILRRIRETTRNEAESESLKLKKEDLSVIYISVGNEGSMIEKIAITDDGDFEGYWPAGFFADQSKELF